MRGTMRRAGALIVAVVLSACAGNRGSDGMVEPGGNTLTVTVQNDGAIPSQVQVFLVQPADQEINLGTMASLGTGTLTTRADFRSGTYRLRAQTGTGAVLFSPPFAARPGDEIIWDMRRNVIQRP